MMSIYLENYEKIYFPQIKEYFREVISSYNNGNYRSAMVMLYSTIVCDLLLKLKELSDVYSDNKAENILTQLDSKIKKSKNSEWEWDLITRISKDTELLSPEVLTTIEHIYDLRNFSAHPAVNDEYELISPSSELTIAYIKKALGDIFTKPSLFAQSIVDRMSDDISDKKEIYYNDLDGFDKYLTKVYLQRMSEKMLFQVFKAFWKFTFLKCDGNLYDENRPINRITLGVILNHNEDQIIELIQQNQNNFYVAQNDKCLKQLCLLLAAYPTVFRVLDADTQKQIRHFNKDQINIIKWFETGDLKRHIKNLKFNSDSLPENCLNIFKIICKKQQEPHLFADLLIAFYSSSNSYSSTRTRFDSTIKKYLNDFSADSFINLIEVINSNKQIYNYAFQWQKNDIILEYAKPVFEEAFTEPFDFNKYPNFKYSKTSEDLSD